MAALLLKLVLIWSNNIPHLAQQEEEQEEEEQEEELEQRQVKDTLQDEKT